VKLIAKSSVREKRYKRKVWKDKWAGRVKNKSNDNANPDTHSLSTPSSSTTSASIASSSASRQRMSGRKKVLKRRSSAYRKIKVLEAKLNESELNRQALRKRLSRVGQSKQNTEYTHLSVQNTPRKSAAITLSSPRKAKRALIFHYSLMADLRNKVSKLKGKEKQACMNLFCAAQLLKKHRLYSMFHRFTGLPRTSSKSKIIRNNRRYLSADKRKAVVDFFERDDVSRMTSGKKETVTRMKDKRQKRFLLQPIGQLYNKFKRENPYTVLSVATFSSLKPLWVTRPRIQDRDTCLCKIHENTRYVYGYVYVKLMQIHCLSSSSFVNLLKALVCDVKDENCMLSKCENCKAKTPLFFNRELSDDELTDWVQWQTINEVSGSNTVRKTVKRKLIGTVRELKKCFTEQLLVIKPHIFTIYH
jgi:hypothetical protein